MATPYKVGATGQSTTAATAKTLVEITAPATRRVLVKEVGIGFASTTSSDGAALVELMRFSGTTGTSTSSTPLLNDPAATAALSTGKVTFTVEPGTPGDVLRAWNVPVQGGLLVYQMPLGEEILVAASGRIGLRVTTPQNQSNVSSYVAFDEVA